MLHAHDSTIHRIFVPCVVLMEAIFPCFNLKHDGCNLATAILHKVSQLHKTLILEGIGWNFSDWRGVTVP